MNKRMSEVRKLVAENLLLASTGVDRSSIRSVDDGS